MMKSLFLLVILVLSAFSQEIDERKIDLYFGNGVWNSNRTASKGAEELGVQIVDKIIKGNEQLQQKYSDVTLVYNWTGADRENNVTFPRSHRLGGNAYEIE